jgi:hypothetical protein
LLLLGGNYPNQEDREASMTTRKLTNDEILDRHKQLVGQLNEMVDIEARKRTFNKEIREELDEVKSQMTRLRREINSGEMEVNPQGKLL